MQGIANALVDNLHVSTTRQLFELDERKLRFDSRRIAIHQEGDRSGRSDDANLGISIAPLFTFFKAGIPICLCCIEKIRRTGNRVNIIGGIAVQPHNI